MIAAMFAICIIYYKNIKFTMKASSFLLAALHLFISGQRSPMLPFLIPIYLSARKNIFKISFIASTLILIFVFTDNPIKDRVSILFEPATLEAAQELVFLDTDGYSYEEFVNYGRGNTSGDLSTILRLKKWIYNATNYRPNIRQWLGYIFVGYFGC